jgi:hypothetical protein
MSNDCLRTTDKQNTVIKLEEKIKHISIYYKKNTIIVLEQEINMISTIIQYKL